MVTGGVAVQLEAVDGPAGDSRNVTAARALTLGRLEAHIAFDTKPDPTRPWHAQDASWSVGSQRNSSLIRRLFE
jgi:hypothetical protein